MDRTDETRIVKTALTAAGFHRVRVTHGRGTAWGWLKLKLSAPGLPYRFAAEWAVAIAYVASGRTGDYDGRIGIDLEREE